MDSVQANSGLGDHPLTAHLVVERQIRKPHTGLLLHGIPFGLSKRIAARGLALLAAMNPAVLPSVAGVSATVLKWRDQHLCAESILILS
jgi:hypothetical protein